MKQTRLLLLSLLAAAGLFSSPSKADTVDLDPKFDRYSEPGLYAWRTASGEWQVRLVGGGAGNASFDGQFEASGTTDLLKRVALESGEGDGASQSGNTLTVDFNVQDIEEEEF